MTHLAMPFAIAHRGVTSALLGPHTTEQPDDLLAEMDVTLTGEFLATGPMRSSRPAQSSALSTKPTCPQPSGARTSSPTHRGTRRHVTASTRTNMASAARARTSKPRCHAFARSFVLSDAYTRYPASWPRVTVILE